MSISHAYIRRHQLRQSLFDDLHFGILIRQSIISKMCGKINLESFEYYVNTGFRDLQSIIYTLSNLELSKEDIFTYSASIFANIFLKSKRVRSLRSSMFAFMLQPKIFMILTLSTLAEMLKGCSNIC